MGQNSVKPVKGYILVTKRRSQEEQEHGQEDDKPPDPRPLRKDFLSAGAKFTELKLREHRAGSHVLSMVSCVH